MISPMAMFLMVFGQIVSPPPKDKPVEGENPAPAWPKNTGS